MASVASPYRPQLSPTSDKKRPLSSLGGTITRPPIKRLKSLNLPSKLSRVAPRGAVALAKPASGTMPGPKAASTAERTGLEGYLDLDQQFVEATKATDDDESRNSVQISTEANYETLINERKQMVGPKRYLL